MSREEFVHYILYFILINFILDTKCMSLTMCHEPYAMEHIQLNICHEPNAIDLIIWTRYHGSYAINYTA